MADYVNKANGNNMVIVMIEDIIAVKNLDQILKVDNIDCFFVAPSDLSQSMGAQYLGKADSPEVQAVYEKAIRQIVAAGRVAGALANDSNIERYYDCGARFMYCNTQGYITNGLKGLQAKVAAKVSARAPARGR